MYNLKVPSFKFLTVSQTLTFEGRRQKVYRGQRTEYQSVTMVKEYIG